MTAASTIVVERHFGASPEKVYEAWLHAGLAGTWLFRTPEGKLERCEVDARVGGRFAIFERRGDELAEHHGEFVELDPPRRLAFDFWTSFSDERTRVAVAIASAGEGARLTLAHAGVWADWADRTREGWTKLLDALAVTLARG